LKDKSNRTRGLPGLLGEGLERGASLGESWDFLRRGFLAIGGKAADGKGIGSKASGSKAIGAKAIGAFTLAHNKKKTGKKDFCRPGKTL
jgi:hypothetical protein